MTTRRDSKDLSIKGESIQTLYGLYLEKQFLVNRRYQRKLVWSIEEKKSFINSIISGYPVPLILLAEILEDSERQLEIIDGMQRLNAIMSFINQEFDIEGQHFDLDTMADTKYLKDSGLLAQVEPRIQRIVCADIARYQIPLSIFQESENGHIDEVFRRLNSGGRHLSRQELRQAGVLSEYANMVRKLSSNIRGDSSASDILDLNSMKNISITNKNLNYGINIEEIFWIKNSIISKEDLRQSKDEEIIADIIAWTSLDKAIRSSSDVLDELYGFGIDSEESSNYQQLQTSIRKIQGDQLLINIQSVFDVIIKVIDLSGKGFNALLFSNQQSRIARYFQVVFYAFYNLLVEEEMELIDNKGLIKTLTNAGDKVITLSAGGGNWSAKEKQTQTDVVVGVIKKHFEKRKNNDPARNQWVTRFENILMQSSTEQTLYDFKVGLHNLDSANLFNNENFNKIIKTLTAMANTQKQAVGYCIIGVADKIDTADKFAELYKTDYLRYSNFYIVGLSSEAKKNHGDIDKYFTKIHQLIKIQPISDRDKDYILRNISLIKYFEKDILILKLESDSIPSIYDNKFHVRHGSNLKELSASEYGDLFKRFN
jgi:hypothetical protein